MVGMQLFWEIHSTQCANLSSPIAGENKFLMLKDIIRLRSWLRSYNFYYASIITTVVVQLSRYSPERTKNSYFLYNSQEV